MRFQTRCWRQKRLLTRRKPFAHTTASLAGLPPSDRRLFCHYFYSKAVKTRRQWLPCGVFPCLPQWFLPLTSMIKLDPRKSGAWGVGVTNPRSVSPHHSLQQPRRERRRGRHAATARLRHVLAHMCMHAIPRSGWRHSTRAEMYTNNRHAPAACAHTTGRPRRRRHTRAPGARAPQLVCDGAGGPAAQHAAAQDRCRVVRGGPPQPQEPPRQGDQPAPLSPSLSPALSLHPPPPPPPITLARALFRLVSEAPHPRPAFPPRVPPPTP